jgi:hypothetical protein
MIKKTNEFGGSFTLLERGDMCTGFWWGIVREREYFVEPDFHDRVILF